MVSHRTLHVLEFLASNSVSPKGTLYLFISAFGVVFIEKHHFNLGQNGLAFLVRTSPCGRFLLHKLNGFLRLLLQGMFVGDVITYALFGVYAMRILKPMFANGAPSKLIHNTPHADTNILSLDFVPETRLLIAMVGGILLPISMCWYGWTSRESGVHWIVPISGLLAVSWAVSLSSCYLSPLSCAYLPKFQG